MTITQTVKIPKDRRLTIEVPREIPTDSVVLTFAPAGSAGVLDGQPLPGGKYSTIEEAIQSAEAKANEPNRAPISRYFGILSPNTYGDGVAYQRAIRDEWDD